MFVIINLTPFWTSILACILMGEPINYLEIIAMCICFVSIVFLTLLSTEATELNYSTNMIYGVTIAFIGGWLYASVNVTSRKLKGIHPGLILLWPAMVGSISFTSFFVVRYMILG